MRNLQQRFWEKVTKTGDCWNWNRKLDIGGYGRIQYQGKWKVASRISWMIKFGNIPKGMLILHKCDNPACVNPEHLFLGTQKDNMKDRDFKQRVARGEKSGQSKLKDEQVLEIRKLYKAGIRIYKIAPLFKVSEVTISYIVRRKTWQHI